MRVLRFLPFLALLISSPAAATTPEAAQWYVSGNQLYYQRQYDQALQHFGQSLRLDNRQAAVYQAVGNCYYAKNQMPLALRYYHYSLQLNPTNEPLKALVARLENAERDPLAPANGLYAARRYAEAAAAYRQVATAQPSNAKAFQGLGNCQYAMGDRVAALSSYKQALALNPNNVALATFVGKVEKVQTAAVNGGSGDKDWFQPSWRSAILPGWGQAYNGEPGKALVLGGLTLGLLAGEVTTYAIGSQAQQQYLSLSGPNADYDTPYNTWSSMAEMNHVFFIGMTAMYAYTLIDAYVNAKPARTVTAQLPDLPANLNVAFSNDGVKLKWTVAQF